jgi:hypothetical protein
MLPDALDIGGVAANQLGDDQLIQTGPHRRYPATQQDEIPHADNAGLGLDFRH